MEDRDKPLLLSCPVINTDILDQLGAVLGPDDLALLEALGTVKKFAKNAVLVYSGERIEQLMFLHKGLARFVDTGKDGTERTFGYYTAGCFLAEPAFFHRQPVLYDIRLLEEAEVRFIDRQHLPRILERPQLMLFLMTSTALMSRILAMQIEDAAFRTTEEKVCRTLVCLSGKEHTPYKPHFTHQEIADLAGVHRVTVTNTLAALKKEGIISFRPRGGITVIDREKLWRRTFKEE
jgi:CRP/FNR family transcriptional regulator